MKAYANRVEDPATTSQSVTTLAHDARRVISGPVNAREIAELIRRIDVLREEWREAPSAPIHAWLVNLRRQVNRG